MSTQQARLQGLCALQALSGCGGERCLEKRPLVGNLIPFSVVDSQEHGDKAVLCKTLQASAQDKKGLGLK